LGCAQQPMVPDSEANRSRRLASCEDDVVALPGELEPAPCETDTLASLPQEDAATSSSFRPRAATDGPAPRRIRDVRARRSVAVTPFEVPLQRGYAPAAPRINPSAVT
ncbi:unnamed protein product, partial [Symbiodinium pilosum]